jgi:hypothetical protein
MSHVLQRFTNEHMCAATLDVYAELLESSAARTLASNEGIAADVRYRAGG